MCTSRLYRVTGPAGPQSVDAEDVAGVCHRLSLLAYDGPQLASGDWLVAHAGYALGTAEPGEAEEAAAQARAAMDLEPRRQ